MLAILLLTYILNLVDRQILGILAVPIKADLGLTDTQLGLLGGVAFVLLYSVMGVPIAWLADRWKRVRIVAISMFVWSGFTAACGYASNFWQLFVCRMGVGIGEAGGVAPAHSLIMDYFPPNRRALAIGIFCLGAPLGAGLGIFFGGWIASNFHWRNAFQILGVAGILLLPILMLGVPEPARSGDPGAHPTTPRRTASVGETARTIAGVRSFWLLSLGAAAGALPTAGLAFWLPAYLQRSHGLELTEISIFQGTILLIGGGFGTWFGGWLGDNAGRRNKGGYALVPALAFLAAAPVFAAAMVMPTLMSTWVLLLLWNGIACIWLGPIIGAVQHIVPVNMRATASASFLFINNIVGNGFGTFFLGFVSDRMTAEHGPEGLAFSMFMSLGFYFLAFVLTGAAFYSLRGDWREAHAPDPAIPAQDAAA